MNGGITMEFMELSIKFSKSEQMELAHNIIDGLRDLGLEKIDTSDNGYTLSKSGCCESTRKLYVYAKIPSEKNAIINYLVMPHEYETTSMRYLSDDELKLELLNRLGVMAFGKIHLFSYVRNLKHPEYSELGTVPYEIRNGKLVRADELN